MTHPITPPPELVRQWRNEGYSLHEPVVLTTYVANCAAQWGADQELEACCEWLEQQRQRSVHTPDLPVTLRAVRRPEPPTLKEQALKALASASGPDYPSVMTVLNADQHALIRRALEQLDD
jgi:hypothetical protein